MISFLALAPLIFTACLCIPAILWFLEQKEALQWQCEKTVLQSQKILLAGADQLIALNAPVSRTVTYKNVLKNLLKAAPPQAKPALLAELIRVEFVLRSLRVQQKVIRASAEARAVGPLIDFRRWVANRAREFLRLWNSSPLFTFARWHLPRIELRENFIDASIPIYERPPDYSRRQSLKLDVLLRGNSLFPPWLAPLNRRPFVWRETCSSHPKNGGRQWQSSLGVAKR